MADILDFTQNTNPASTVAIYIVNDPSGTPADQYALLSDLLKNPGVIGSGTAANAFFAVLDVSGASALDGLVTLGAGMQCADTAVTRALMEDYAIKYDAKGSTSGTTSLDYTAGQYKSATIGAATTFTFDNPPASGRAGVFLLELTNGGAFTVTWPGSVDWASATAPSLTAAGVDLLAFTTRDGGTTWFGLVLAQALA